MMVVSSSDVSAPSTELYTSNPVRKGLTYQAPPTSCTANPTGFTSANAEATVVKNFFSGALSTPSCWNNESMSVTSF